jgi:hypothetical protein
MNSESSLLSSPTFSLVPWELIIDILCSLDLSTILRVRLVCKLLLECCNKDATWKDWELYIQECPAMDQKCRNWPFYKKVFFQERLMCRYHALMGLSHQNIDDHAKLHAYHLLVTKHEKLTLVQTWFPIGVYEEDDNRSNYYGYFHFCGETIDYENGSFVARRDVFSSPGLFPTFEQKLADATEFLEQSLLQGYAIRTDKHQLELYRGTFIPPEIETERKKKGTCKLFKFGVFKMTLPLPSWCRYQHSKLNAYEQDRAKCTKNGEFNIYAKARVEDDDDSTDDDTYISGV